MTTPFQAAYQKLNEAQRVAVDTIDGPVMVVAGPGTGKTQVLTTRIASILKKTDERASNILALTFTETAAQNMRVRLSQLIGSEAYRVQIATFHSFCDEVIRNNVELFPLNPASQPVTELEQLELLRAIIEETPLEILKPLNAPLHYVRKLRTAVSAYKREGVTASQLRDFMEAERVDPDQIAKATERSKTIKRQKQLEEEIVVYEAYENRLRAANRYDFDDMVSLTAQAFAQHSELLQQYQEQYHYVLVDEYQDTNNAQNSIIRQLTAYWGEEANVFVVGDPHQSIFRFQGASLENIIRFVEWFPSATVITLTTGYRCPQLIYDAAHSVMTRDTSLQKLQTLGTGGQALAEALSKRLAAATAKADGISIRPASDQMTGVIAMVKEIKQLIESGVSPDEIALLYTQNKTAQLFLPILEKWQVPYALEGGINALEQPIIQQLVQLCTVVVGLRQGDEISRTLLEVLSYPWLELDRMTLFQLARNAHRRQQPLLEIICAVTTEAESEYASAEDRQRLESVRQKIRLFEAWSADDWSLPFEHWLEQVAQQSGLRDWLLAHAESDLQPLLAYYSVFGFIRGLDAQQKKFHAADFVKTYQTMIEEHIAISIQSPEPAEHRIKLSTVHGAKGQEWEYVFLTQVLDGVWGGQRSRAALPVPAAIVEQLDQTLSTAELQEQEDRRLFYVALTRARQKLEIWYPESIEQQGRSKATAPSMFIGEMDHAARIPSIKVAITEDPVSVIQTLTAPRVTNSTELTEYVRSLTNNFTLSVSALNDYLRDPKQFLLKHILRLPEAVQPTLAYGAALHRALEEYGKVLSSKKDVDTDALKNLFAITLAEQKMPAEEKQRRLARGQQVLAEYIGQALRNAPIWKTEYVVGGGLQVTQLSGIRLKGRMDRLDWLDEEKKFLHVIDYKTGRLRTKGELLANTQESLAQLSQREQLLPETIRSPYQRQLLFYRLLSQLHPIGMPLIEFGSFDFVEAPLEKGKPIIHRFALTDDATRELRELITVVSAEITEATFLEEIDW